MHRINPAGVVSFESTPRRGGRAAECGGLLIHPDLFAQTDFRLFCLRYGLLSCAETPHLQSIVQQVFSKKLPAFPHSDGTVRAFISRRVATIQ